MQEFPEEHAFKLMYDFVDIVKHGTHAVWSLEWGCVASENVSGRID